MHRRSHSSTFMLVDSGGTVGVDNRAIELTLAVDTGGGLGEGRSIDATFGVSAIAGGVLSGRIGVDRGEATGDCH